MRSTAWVRFDEDDQHTWPTGIEPVIAIMVWTKLRFKKPDGTPAPFFQSFVGRFERCDDGETRFLLDHGDGYLDDPGEENEDYIEAGSLKYWSYITLPEDT